MPRGSELRIANDAVWISASIRLKCNNSKECGVEIKTDNQRSCFLGNKNKYSTIKLFATNVFLILGLQQIGAGRSDCGVFLLYLNLLSAASFQSESFSDIENCTRPMIKKSYSAINERGIGQGLNRNNFERN